MERWVAISVAIVGLNLAGCAPKPSLLGKWQDTETRTLITEDNPTGVELGPKTVICYYEFRSDGIATFECTHTAANVTQKQYFRYSVSGDRLTSTLYDFEVIGILDESRKKRMIEGYRKLFGKPEVYEITLLEEKTLHLDLNGSKMEFVRSN